MYKNSTSTAKQRTKIPKCRGTSQGSKRQQRARGNIWGGGTIQYRQKEDIGIGKCPGGKGSITTARSWYVSSEQRSATSLRSFQRATALQKSRGRLWETSLSNEMCQTVPAPAVPQSATTQVHPRRHSHHPRRTRTTGRLYQRCTRHHRSSPSPRRSREARRRQRGQSRPGLYSRSPRCRTNRYHRGKNTRSTVSRRSASSGRNGCRGGRGRRCSKSERHLITP